VQGLERARNHGIASRVIEHRGFASREDFDRALVAALVEHGVELVVCAGFMRLLSPVMLAAFPDRVMNIHPALVPAFPGIHAQKAALEYGVRFTGCTVFFVREGVDDGPIIVQAVVPVMPGDNEASLSERIRAQEHRIYPWAIQLYQEGRLTIEGRTVRIADFPAGDESLALVHPRSPHSPRLKRPH
jgi:phosphoribosylglycinamide formyltransferase-1